MPNIIQAIIWDLDGVIIDSADEHRRAWQRLAREEGIVMTDADFWATDQVVPWDRYTAIARAAAVSSDRTPVAWGTSRDAGRTIGSHPYAGWPDPRWHQLPPSFPRPSP